MSRRKEPNRLRGFVLATLWIAAVHAHAVDETGAQKLLKDSKCLTCHSVDKKKDGPPYKEIAVKYKDDPDAIAKLTKHITEPSKVEIDGEEEDHGSVKTRDADKVSNLVRWILSR